MSSYSYTSMRGMPTDSKSSGEMVRYQQSNRYGNRVNQSEVMVAYTANVLEMESRRTTAEGTGYPGGAHVVHLQIRDGDPVFTFKRSGISQKNTAFSSINGLQFGNARTLEELETMLTFAGQAQSDYDVINERGSQQTLQHGYSVLFYGSTTFKMAWQYTIYPGDRLIWRLPTLQEANRFQQKKSDPGSPAGKLTMIIGPLDWGVLRYQLHSVVKYMMDPGNRLTGKPVYEVDSNSSVNSFSRTANYLKKTTLVTAVRSVEQLAMRGIVEIVTPKDHKKKKAEKKYLAQIKALMDRLNTEQALQPNAVKTLSQVDTSDSDSILAYLAHITQNYDRATGDADRQSAYDETNDERFTQPFSYYKHAVNLAEDGLPSLGDKVANDYKIERIDRVLWLARSLGIVKHRGLNHLSPSSYNQDPVQDILGSVYMLFAGPETADKYHTRTALLTSDALSNKQSSELDDYYEVSKNHVLDFQKAMATMREHVLDKTVGTAMTYAPGGSNLVSSLDVLVRGGGGGK